MRKSNAKNGWILLIFLLAGLVIGGLLGNLADGIKSFEWLNYGQTFGLNKPLELNLGILMISFALQIKITVCGIIGLIIGAIIYKFI